MEDKDVKVKMSICPDCGNAIRIAVLHTMENSCILDFAIEVFENDLQVKTVTLEEYRSSKIELFCKENCPRKLQKGKQFTI